MFRRPISWVFLCSVAAVLACGGTASEAPPAGPASALLTPSDTTQVVRAPISSGPRVSGTLEPAEKAVLRAEAPGTVVAVGAELGDAVARGAMLAQVENHGIQSNVSAAEAGVLAAQQDLANARRDLDRTRKLAAAGALSPRELELAEGGVLAAEARAAQARTGRAAAGEQLEGVQVRSPIDGVVAARSVSVGDVVAPGLPLFVVIDPRSLRLEASVPAASAGEVHPGGAVMVEVQGYAAPVTGTIARVAPAVDPATRQLTLLVDIPNPDGTLIAGLFASGRIAVGLHDGLVLPADAVNGTGDAAKVLRIRDGVVEEVSVRLGVVDAAAEVVEVLEGLAEGDRVLVGKARELPVGSAVTLAGEG